MAKNEENNLIGYDPLAWMEGEDVGETGDQPVADEIGSDINLEEQLADSGINTSDAYPSDLLDDAQESEVSSEIEIEEIIENRMSDDAFDDMAKGIEESEISNEVEIEHNSDVVEEAAEDLAADNMGGSQVDLAPTLTIQHVVSLCEKLKASLGAHDQIEINASDVVSIDTSTLQLLVALKKEAAKRQKEVTIIYPSPRFVESAQLLGLSDILEVHD